MKKVFYDYMTEDQAKKEMELGQYAKTEPIMSRSSKTDLYGKPYKMYKITKTMEEVPHSQIKYYFDGTDLKQKYTKEQIKAGAELYQKKPKIITESKDHGYNNYTRQMYWNELGAETQEKYIKLATITDEDEDWWP